jgi:hypothetical protein
MAERKKSLNAVLGLAGQGKSAETLAKAEDMGAAEFQANTGRKLQRVITKLVDRLEHEAQDIPLGSLSLNVGILVDKLATLGGGGAPIANQTNIQINGLSRAELAGLLTGQRIKVSRGDDVTLNGTRQNLPTPSASFAKSGVQPISRQRPDRLTPVDVDVSPLSVNAESTVPL